MLDQSLDVDFLRKLVSIPDTRFVVNKLNRGQLEFLFLINEQLLRRDDLAWVCSGAELCVDDFLVNFQAEVEDAVSLLVLAD